MKITKKEATSWFGFGSKKQERKLDGPSKARCIHCSREFRTSYGFHLACKTCRTEEDYLRSFEWALAAVGVKA